MMLKLKEHFWSAPQRNLATSLNKTRARNPSVGISTKVDPKVGINQSEASIWVLSSTLTLMPTLGFRALVKNICQKKFDQKNFGSKKFLGHKNFLV